MNYDLVIVGGGMVGAASALALSDSALRIALIDAAITHTEDARLIALNKGSCLFLESLNLWPALSKYATPIQEVHVSHQGRFGSVRLTASEMELDKLGCVIPAKYINAALYKELENIPAIDVIRPAKLTAILEEPSQVRLMTECQKTLEANWVIAADGTHSSVRNLLHVPVETFNYHQKAIVTVTTLQRSHHHIAYERFLADGAIAMLPLENQQAATIWSGDENEMDNLLLLSDEDFLQALQKNFGYRLGRFQQIHQRFSYPLMSVKAKEQIKDRVLFLGNAAHTLHPIAAQGLNLALHEVQVITDHLRNTSVFSWQGLSDSFKQQSVRINLSHYLTCLFAMDFFPVSMLRQMAMLALDSCSPVKRRFIERLL